LRDEPLAERIRVRGVRAPEDRAGALVDVPDVVAVTRSTAEVPAVAVVDEREDAAADGDARLAVVPCALPRLAEGMDVARLHDVERVAARIVLDEGRAHQVHPERRRPRRGLVRSRAPP